MNIFERSNTLKEVLCDGIVEAEVQSALPFESVDWAKRRVTHSHKISHEIKFYEPHDTSQCDFCSYSVLFHSIYDTAMVLASTPQPQTPSAPHHPPPLPLLPVPPRP